MEASTDNWTGDDLEPITSDGGAQSIHASDLDDPAEPRTTTTDVTHAADAGTLTARHAPAARNTIL